MESKEIKRLRYRRQYILAPKKINCPFEGNFHEITDTYTLYSHVDLQFCKVDDGATSVILLGDLFDFRNSTLGNQEILKEIITSDFQRFIESLSIYSGRFVIIFIHNNQIFLIHDAMAARKVYYVSHDNELWIASQPHILAKTLNIQHTRDEEKIDFFKSDTFHKLNCASIGNLTCYDEIFQLMPNHYLDVNARQIERFWPNKVIQLLPVEEIVRNCSEMLKGFMESIVYRYNVMLPVTAGKDSRMLLAASRNCNENIFFYINNVQNFNSRSTDVITPMKLFKKLNLRFNIIDPFIAIDEDFRKIYYLNNPYASKKYLPHIYNYYKNFSDRVNLPGNIASAGYEAYKHKNMKVTAESLAHLNTVGKYKFGIAYYENWLMNCKDICAIDNLTLIHLFYWEERMGNWATQVQSDKDIAQEEFNPFNSRQLIETFLSAPRNYIDRPYFILQHEITSFLWPELLNVPINPSNLNTILKILKRIGILDFAQMLKYEIGLLKEKMSY